MQHEVLLVGAFQAVDVLLVFGGAEGGDHQGLGFAAGEQGRAVGARQNARLGRDRTHGGEIASVDADMGIEHGGTHDLGFEVVHDGAELDFVHLPLALADELSCGFLGDGGDGILTGMLFRNLESGRQFRPDIGLDRIVNRLGGVDGDFARLFRRFLRQPDDGLDHRLHLFMPEHHRTEHLAFGKFLGFGFHHQHGVVRAGDHQIELRFRHLVDGRIEPVLAVEKADARRPDRPHEGNAGNRQRRRGRHQRQDVGIVFHVVAEHGDDHLGLVFIPFGEKRTDRPVDQTRDQRFAFGRTAFALEVAARNLAGGEELFLIIDGEGEKIDAFFGFACSHHGGEHDAFPVAGEHGAVGLAGDFAGFEDELASAPVEFLTCDIEHVSVILSFPSFPRSRIAAAGYTLTDMAVRQRARSTRCASRGPYNEIHRRACRSAAQTQLADQRFVTFGVDRFEIIEKTAALRNQLDQAAARMVVLGVGLEVFGQVGNALREHRHLHFRRAGVVGFGCIFLDEFGFTFSGNSHAVIHKVRS